jgi:hypothetical protein
MSLIDRIRDLFGGRQSSADYGTAATSGAVGAEESDEGGADAGGGDFGAGGGDGGGSGGGDGGGAG